MLVITACNSGSGQLREGSWRVSLSLGEGISLPFNWTVKRDSATRHSIIIHNASEEILVDDISLISDSFHAQMPLFESEFNGRLTGDSLIRGEWWNRIRGNAYRIPFEARAGSSKRFGESCSSGYESFNGTWAARFSPGTPDAYNSVGIFTTKKDGSVIGTFLTETGDYRFLEGAACGDSMFLSCFDGTHAFLFTCNLRNDSLIGRFWSGVHWQEPWVAYFNPDYRLRNPDSLTALRTGYDAVDFRFKDTDGLEHSPKDASYEGRPLVVHIMGSWCPNCVDETRLLTEMSLKYRESGLRILAIAFEKHSDEGRAVQGLRRFKEELGVPYPILFGGPAAKDKAAANLPFLNHLMSYPTCIFIDRKGRVRRVRTGFYGPGTGSHYTDYKEHLEAYLLQLLNEPE